MSTFRRQRFAHPHGQAARKAVACREGKSWTGPVAYKMMNEEILVAGLIMLFMAACGSPHPLNDLEPGERGRVVRVIDGDALVLNTGQSVRLVCIEAPARPYKDRAGQTFHKESKRMLEDLTLGREVQLYYGGLTRDRYDRALAHVMTADELGSRYWLNAEMVKRGGARLRVYPDTARGCEPLIELEGSARTDTRGLWASAAYDIPSAAQIPAGFSRFQIVEGIVTERSIPDAPFTVCRLSFENASLGLHIKREAAQLCQTPAGTRLRARGYVTNDAMEIVHLQNVETF